MVELAPEVRDGSLLGKRVAVLGAACKPGSDDIRDSPALNVAAQRQLRGAVVRVTDPVAFGRSVTQRRVLDGRNALDREAWTAAGWTYRALGRRAG